VIVEKAICMPDGILLVTIYFDCCILNNVNGQCSMGQPPMTHWIAFCHAFDGKRRKRGSWGQGFEGSGVLYQKLLCIVMGTPSGQDGTISTRNSFASIRMTNKKSIHGAMLWIDKGKNNGG
jgi:hypothetical protein